MKGSSGPFNPGQALNQALSLHRQGQLREAEKIYARVLKAAPDNFDALNLLGAIRMQQGQFGEARGLFSAAVKANPGIAAAWCNLGQAEYALKRPAEALQYFEKAQALAPDDADILYQHANALLSLDRPRDALAELQMVLARKPQHFEARLNSGLAQATLGFPDRALADFDAALALAPQHPVAHYNRGVALIRLGRYAEAVAANDRAIAAAPQHSGAWLNRGRAMVQLRRMDDAIKSYGEVLALSKHHADAHFNQALALLTIGDYRHGFSEYEWRWRRTGMPPQKSRGRPLWLGEYPLAGKTILLHAEQGFGDTIQFARYVPLVAARGANVVLEVQPELKSLLSRLEGAAAVVARGETPLSFDVHCPLGSLPLALKTELHTVPAPLSYLSADETYLKKWSARLQKVPQPRVAVAWSGNPAHDNDRNRSLPFGALAPLFPPSNLRPLAGERGVGMPSFISIQRDLRSEDAACLAAETRVMHIGGELDDFSDTAAVLALCDLVISVDTAPVHLAGAMGRPVWVLVPFAPDWRWTLEGDITPWYPTARLFRQDLFRQDLFRQDSFRQDSPGDWDAVIACVAAALKLFGLQK
jgi:tetratricopeptide (TPR) repeat protein